jgi:Domain of unknown function (DUF4157)/Lipase (class 3)
MQTHALMTKQTASPALAPPQRAPALRSILLNAGAQPKLRVGAVDDPAEAEADRVADRIMRMPEPRLVSSASEPPPDQRNILRRKCAHCEEEEKVQRKKLPGAAASHAGGALSPAAEAAVNSLGPGAPLPASERAFFEPRFGHSLSHVKVHDGAQAAHASTAINARAFALGSSVAFARGEYQPVTRGGRELMAHELAHVENGSTRSNLVSRKELLFAQIGSAKPGDTYQGLTFTEGRQWSLPEVIVEGYQSRLEFLLYALEMLKVSQDVYGETPQNFPSHISRVSVVELVDIGLDPDDFHFSDGAISGLFESGMQAWLYFDEKRKTYILAFRGSEVNADITNDFISADLRNAISAPVKQYEQAAALAKKVAAALALHRKGSNLVFTGHSLGGGLAELAAIATELPATTFNAAGATNYSIYAYAERMSLSEVFIDPYSQKSKKFENINSVYVSGEMVSFMQDLLPFIASSKGKRIPLFSSKGNFFTNHTVENIAFALQEAILDVLTPVDPSSDIEEVREIHDATAVYVKPLQLKTLGPEWLQMEFMGKKISVPNPQRLTQSEYGKFLNRMNEQSVKAQGQLFGPDDDGWDTSTMSDGAQAGRQARLDYKKYEKLYGASKLMKTAIFMQHVGWPMLNNFEGLNAQPNSLPKYRQTPQIEGRK